MSAPSRVKDLDGLDTRFAWKDGMTLPVKTRPGNNGNAAVVATTGRVLVEFSGIPVVVHNRLGKGETLLLNLNLARNDRQSASDLIAGLLDGAGVSTPVRFLPEPGPIASEGAGGLEMSGAVRSRYGLLEKGDLTLLGVIMNHLAGQWNGGKVILPEAKHVYDVKAGKYLGKLKEIEVAGRNDVQSAALFALQKERIKAVKLTAPKAAERGQPVTIACEVRAKGDFSCEGRVVRIKLCGPDGEKRVHYRRMAHLDKNGWGRASVQFAFNDPTGPWNVIATDIASGVNATAKLVLK